MDISEWKRGDRQRLARMIARESNAMQRDRLRSVLLVLQGRQTLEVTATVGRSRAVVQRWAYAYRDGGIDAVRGRTPPGRRPRLSPEQQARFVQRVKAGGTPRDGVASLRGRGKSGHFGSRVRQDVFAQRGVPTTQAPRIRVPRASAEASPAESGRSEGPQAARPPFVNRVRASRPRTKLRVWFQDEARFGQEGTLTAVWAIKGSRPTVIRQNGRKSIWMFAAVEPATGWPLAMPFRDVSTETMQAFLDAAASKLHCREHAVMMLDGAG